MRDLVPIGPVVLYRLTCEDIESRVLEKIQDVVEIDISKQNPLSGTSLENETFDAITAWLCLSTVPPFDIEGYKNVLGNIRYVQFYITNLNISILSFTY